MTGKPHLALALLLTAAPAVLSAEGLLRIHPQNPRYLTDDSGRAIVLTGSHTWASLQDYSNVVPPDPPFNYDGTQGVGGFSQSWLGKLTSWNHNFFRGWHFEDAYYEPWPYLGTCPGTGCTCNPQVDANCKFQLNQPNPTYATHIRQRARSAADRGLYLSVMLFQSWSVHRRPNTCGSPARSPDPWPTHPYKIGNHWPFSPDIDGDPNGDGFGWELHEITPSSDSRIVEKQRAYVKKIIDTLHQDPIAWDAVIWQIGNEFNNDDYVAMKTWMYGMVDYIQSYELSTYGEKHLVWVDSLENADLFEAANPADIVSPLGDNGYGTVNPNPPAATGTRVILSDSDHLPPCPVTREWAWKSFMRGLHPQFMDLGFDLTWWQPGSSCCVLGQNDPRWPEIRHALGGMQTLAAEVDLAVTQPQAKNTSSPASSQYSLYAADRSELLVYHQDNVSTVSVCSLPPGASYTHRELKPAASGVYFLADRAPVTAGGGGCVSLTKTTSEDAVHYLETGVAPQPPVAVIATVPNPPSGTAPLTVQFDGTGSYDPDGGQITYMWDFKNDGSFDATGPTASYTYGQGTFTALLKVTDDEGETDEATKTITVSPGTTVIASDNFNSGVPGRLLKWRRTPVGNLTWYASWDYFISQTRGLTGTDGKGVFSHVAHTPSSRPVKVAADIKPKGSNWSAIGFSRVNNRGFRGQDNGQVWVWLKPNGVYAVWSHGMDHRIKRATARQFSSNGHNRVELEYDPAANRVTLWINGVLELNNAAVPITPVIRYASTMIGAGTREVTDIDNFELTLE